MSRLRRSLVIYLGTVQVDRKTGQCYTPFTSPLSPDLRSPLKLRPVIPDRLRAW